MTELHPFHVPRLVAAVSAVSGVPADDITGPRRTRAAVHARWVVILLAREAGLSLQYIGQQLGDRDHSTIIFAWGHATDAIRYGSPRGVQAAAWVAATRQRLIDEQPAKPTEPESPAPGTAPQPVPVRAVRPRHGRVNKRGEIIVIERAGP